MKKPITIGNRTFAKKGDAIKFIQDILRSVSLSQGQTASLTDEQLSIAKDVLSMHPRLNEKIPDYPRSLETIVIRRSYGEKYNQFCYVLRGREPEPFSYIKCLSDGKNYHVKEVFEALRRAIEPQIIEFRDNHVYNGRAVCALSGIEFDESDLHVDHRVPFKKIVDMFLEENNLSFNDIEIDHHDNDDKLSTIKDEKLLESFSDFHRKHAELSLIHKKLNLSLSDRLKEGKRYEETLKRFIKENEKSLQTV